MIRNKASKKKVKPKQDVFPSLDRYVNNTIGTLATDFRIEIIIESKDDFVWLIENEKPEELVEMARDVMDVLESLGALDNPIIEIVDPDKIVININFLSLLRYRRQEQRFVVRLPNEIKENYPANILAVIYWIIIGTIGLRLLHYLQSHAYSRDVFYVYAAGILEADKFSKPYLEHALTNLGVSVRNKYENVTGREPYPEGKTKTETNMKYDPNQKLYSLIWEISQEVFPKSLRESFIKALKGHKEISGVPISVRNKLIDEYRKYEKRKALSWGHIQYAEENNLPEDFQSLESIKDISQLTVAEKLSDLKGCIDSIKDPEDQQIARLKLIKRLTIREIAKKLSLSKSDVDRRIKRLKKYNLPF